MNTEDKNQVREIFALVILHALMSRQERDLNAVDTALLYADKLIERLGK